MKRDMELIRNDFCVLFKIEEMNEHSFTNADLVIEGYGLNDIDYNCKLLADKGLIFDYEPFDADDGLCAFSASALTWDGHDFLDKIPEDTTWKKIKKILSDKGLPILIETVKDAFVTIMPEAQKSYLLHPSVSSFALHSLFAVASMT